MYAIQNMKTGELLCGTNFFPKGNPTGIRDVVVRTYSKLSDVITDLHYIQQADKDNDYRIVQIRIKR